MPINIKRTQRIMEETKLDAKKDSGFWELIKYAVLAILIVVPFRIFVAQPYVVNGSSMDPTFHDGDYLIVDQISKRFEVPDRGSVVIIRYPKDLSKFFIKRLIAYPGEQVDIRGGVVYVINEQNPEGLKLDDSYVEFKKNENFSITLKDDQYFVMGDNRAGSSDSRIWGPINKKNIVGEPIVRLLPLQKIDLLPGAK